MSKTLKILISLVVVAWAVCALSGDATAATVGKVTGRVLDEKGDPLPGANVVLEGTRRGATTDADGSYVILSIDPDVYTAKASMVGYHTATTSGVDVRADYTTTLNFTLREGALELEEMVVVAERPLVEPDKTESRYTVTAEEISRTPILRNVTEVVALEPGMAKDGSMVIRGWEASENTVYVDGIEVYGRDARGIGGGWGSGGEQQWWGVNVKAVQEISVITGGMNAEYGNAMAGVISIVTRDGGRGYHGEAEYRLTPSGKKHWGANVYEAPELRDNVKWNDPEWVGEVDPVTGRLIHQRTNYTDRRGHYFDGTLSGPLANTASFFLSARHQRDAAVLPGPWETRPPNIRTTSKLTFSVTPDVRLRLGWVYDKYEDFNNGRMSRYSFGEIIRSTGRDLFIPAGSPAGEETYKDNMIYAVFTHTISPKTFYELRAAYYKSNTDTSNTGTVSTAARTDKAGYFYIGRDDVWAFKVGEQKRMQLKADLSSQISKGHFFKTGAEFHTFNNYWTWTGMTPGDAKRDMRYVGQPGPGDRMKPKQFSAYLQDKMEFEGLVVNAGIRYDRLWGPDVQLLPTFTSNWFDTLDRYIQAPTAPMRPISAWGPRLGISHPITDRSSLHFTYGKYVMLPSFRKLFGSHFETASGPAGIAGVEWSQFNAKDESPSNNAMSGAWDNAHHMNSFEVGSHWNFVSDYVLTSTAFYKSGNFQPGTAWHDMVDPKTGRLGKIGGTYNANRAEDVKGFEFSMIKRFSNYFSFRAALNIEWLEGQHWLGDFDANQNVLTFPDSSFVASGRYFWQWEVVGNKQVPVALTDAEIREIGHSANENLRKVRANVYAFNAGGGDHVIREAWLAPGLTGGQDYLQGIWYQMMSFSEGNIWSRGRSSQGAVQVFVSSPPDLGPGRKLGGSTLLGGINANLIWRIYAGSKFNYQNIDGKRRPGRGPMYTNADLNVQKRLNFGRLNADVFFEVFNVFAQKDASVSGTDYMWYGLQKPRPNEDIYKQHGDPNDRSRYIGNPRTTHMGIRLSF